MPTSTIAERAARRFSELLIGHQDRESASVQDVPCDTTEYQLVEAGVAVGPMTRRSAPNAAAWTDNAAHVLAADDRRRTSTCAVVMRQYRAMSVPVLAVTRLRRSGSTTHLHCRGPSPAMVGRPHGRVAAPRRPTDQDAADPMACAWGSTMTVVRR